MPAGRHKHYGDDEAIDRAADAFERFMVGLDYLAESVWWREGYDAFGEYQRDDCPYSESQDKQKFDEWQAGYSAASIDQDGPPWLKPGLEYV